MKLDYFTGQQVDSVFASSDEKGAGWSFVNGPTIWSGDEQLVIPDEIKGTIMIKADADTGQVEFGYGGDPPNVVATISVDSKKAATASAGSLPPSTPTTSEEQAEHLPPDPSPDRVADGPETP